MNKEIKSDTWIWVVIQDPGANEQFLGQLDEDKSESFIPAFFQKEDAQQCLIQLKTKKGKKYEVQAICFDELAKDAAKNDFMIFMLTGDGSVRRLISNPEHIELQFRYLFLSSQDADFRNFILHCLDWPLSPIG